MKQATIRISISGFALLAVLAAGPATAKAVAEDRDPGALCDRLAATNDGSASAPPVRLRDMKANAAAQACQAAVAAPGTRPRHHLQLARALIKLGRPEAARAHLVTAAGHANAAALYILGQLHHTGLGVAQDKSRAFRLYRRALRQGYLEAAYGLIRLLEDPKSAHFDPVEAEAARLLLMGGGRL
ncbi:MAG: hypothetical protein ACFBRM_00415 [Pikeienuella sp.]